MHHVDTIFRILIQSTRSSNPGSSFSSLLSLHFRCIFLCSFCRSTRIACARLLCLLSIRISVFSSMTHNVFWSYRHVPDDNIFGKENRLHRYACYVNIEGSSQEDVHPSQTDQRLCLSTRSLRDSINESPAAGQRTRIGGFVHGCTAIGPTTRQAKYLRVSESYARTPFRTSSSRSDMSFGWLMSIYMAGECIDTISHSFGEM